MESLVFNKPLKLSGPGGIRVHIKPIKVAIEKFQRQSQRRSTNTVHSIDGSFSLKAQTFEDDATTTTNFSNYFDTQTIDFCRFLPFSIIFIVFVHTAENDMKTIRKRCVVAFALKMISFLMETYLISFLMETYLISFLMETYLCKRDLI